MINVGVIGLGMMGSTHLDAYGKRPDARVVAVSDQRVERLEGRERAAGNISGQAKGGSDLSSVKRYTEGLDLIADPEVQLVDVCLPTPLHRRYVEAALQAGKHVLCEKPLARTSGDAFAIADAAANAKGLAMPAMCMRFWPGWDWLKQAIDEGRYGRVRSAHFRRLSAHPGGAFYSNGAASGGAILDLHIHDTDFVHYCFGVPKAVFSRGHTHITDAVDYVVTHYLYDDGPNAGVTVTAEGGWSMTPGFGFSMQYTVNFERATAVFDISGSPTLHVVADGKRQPVELSPTLGYEHEIGYFLDCIRQGVAPERVTLEQGAISVAIVEAEAASVASGKITPVELSRNGAAGLASSATR